LRSIGFSDKEKSTNLLQENNLKISSVFKNRWLNSVIARLHKIDLAKKKRESLALCVSTIRASTVEKSR